MLPYIRSEKKSKRFDKSRKMLIIRTMNYFIYYSGKNVKSQKVGRGRWKSKGSRNSIFFNLQKSNNRKVDYYKVEKSRLFFLQGYNLAIWNFFFFATFINECQRNRILRSALSDRPIYVNDILQRFYRKNIVSYIKKALCWFRQI